MAFLRRLLGRGGASDGLPGGAQVRLTVQDPGAQNALAEVPVGGVVIPAVTYRDYEREADWTSGIRLEHPLTGHWLLSDEDYPESVLRAGGRPTAIVGLPYHPDAQRAEFGLGRLVRLIQEPSNPVNPAAIAVRSVDGRYLAGYIPDDDLAKVRGTTPAPSVGLVVWERWTVSPRVRRSIRLLVGPSIDVRLIPTAAVPAELARREAQFAAGSGAERAAAQAERLAAHEAKAAALEVEREHRHAQRVAEHTEKASARAPQAATWRAAGLCVDCGAALGPSTGGRGRPPIRCELHRHNAPG